MEEWTPVQWGDIKVDTLLNAKATAQAAANQLKTIIKADDSKAAAEAAVYAKIGALKGRV
jgi:hypothetical protein